MTFKEFAQENIVLFDGAMGTKIQRVDIDDSIWVGRIGCNEFLNIVAPDIIEAIHKDYFRAGSNVAVANTFGAIRLVLDEYDLGDRVVEINQAAVKLARNAAMGDSNKFVSLSIGPGTKLVSLDQISYDKLYSQYCEQVESVINDIDLVNIETSQDLLQIRAAINAVRDTANRYNRDIPILVSITVESNNTLLTGTDIETVVTVLSRMDIYALGLNCAMGPDLMIEPLKSLSSHYSGRLYISPNAGLPESINGETVYPMQPEKFTEIIKDIFDNFPISMIGGCCGTDERYISNLATIIKNYKLPKHQSNTSDKKGFVSSLFVTNSLNQIPSPAFIGERANATGSKLFREALLSSNTDKMIEIAKNQESEGAHFIDLSLAYTGRDEIEDYLSIMPLINQRLIAPLVIDSTSTKVMEESIKRYSGKPIINSTNLEDGGEKLHYLFKLIKSHPAAIIALTIDETGMAQTEDHKVDIAKKIYDIWCNEYNYPAEDLIIDPLTFSIGSGDISLKTAAIETLGAIKRIKAECKGVKTVLGLSNVSYGLATNSRPILNSVFLDCAIQAGLDIAIAHSSKLVPISKLSDKDIEISKNLIFNVSDDALNNFIIHFADTVFVEESYEDLEPEEKLFKKIIAGDKTDIEPTILKLLDDKAATDIINNILLPAMQKVGAEFSEGRILLPFVLQSAEAMKRAVSILEPYIEKNSESRADTIILATVTGDVHDIGKNLVDIILTNNGYNVINLGIKISVDEMIAAAKKHSAIAIGMSGLLVKSTLIMRDNISKIATELDNIKVLLGGAALTRKYVRKECSVLLEDKVFYCRDAFDAINALEGKLPPTSDNSSSDDKLKEKKSTTNIDIIEVNNSTNKNNSNDTNSNNNIIISIDTKQSQLTFSAPPIPAFFGIKLIEKYPLKKALHYLDRSSLFKRAWGYKIEDDISLEKAEDEYNTLLDKLIKEDILQLKAIYGFFKVMRKGDILEIYDTNNNSKLITSFEFPYFNNRSLIDYFPDNIEDIIAMQIVTIGAKTIAYSKQNFTDSRYKEYLLTHGFFTFLADALAEAIHSDIRSDLGFADTDQSSDDILQGKHRSRRYSFGYPIIPDLSGNKEIINILDAKRIGITLNTTFQMEPEFTTSAIVIHHQEAKY